jgi:hypothetical protein
MLVLVLWYGKAVVHCRVLWYVVGRCRLLLLVAVHVASMINHSQWHHMPVYKHEHSSGHVVIYWRVDRGGLPK